MDAFNVNKGKVIGLLQVKPVEGLNDYGRQVGYIDPPTFCAAISEADIERAHNAIKDGRWDDPVFSWNPARHKDAKNPEQCERARLNDLMSDRWYRESPASLLKNLGAGIVNGLIPGSDLGDADSSTQIAGNLIGSTASLFVNPVKAISMSFGSTISKAFSFVNKVTSGPIGTIAASAIGSMFPIKTQAIPFAASQQIYSGAQPNNVTEQALSYAQRQIFNAPNLPAPVKDALGVSDKWSTTKIVAVGAGVIAALAALYFLFFKKRKR